MSQIKHHEKYPCVLGLVANAGVEPLKIAAVGSRCVDDQEYECEAVHSNGKCFHAAPIYID